MIVIVNISESTTPDWIMTGKVTNSLNENYAIETIDDIISSMMSNMFPIINKYNYTKLLFHGITSKTLYDFVFWIEIDGKQIQCFQLVDSGELDSSDISMAFKNMRDEFWNSGLFSNNKIYEISIACNTQDTNFAIASYANARYVSIYNLRKAWKANNKIK